MKCLKILLSILIVQSASLSSQSFSEYTDLVLPDVTGGIISWGDYNNDGYLDLLLTGMGSTAGSRVSIIYKNNGDTTFAYQSDITLASSTGMDPGWGDYDNDGDLDILFEHYTGVKWEYVIYRNDGSNTFSPVALSNIEEFNNRIASWGDYDNDGDLDLAVSGLKGVSPYTNGLTLIYKNMGNDTFIKQDGIELNGYASEIPKWGDYNKDGYLDLLVSGMSEAGEQVICLYRNNGDNSFSKEESINLTGISVSSFDLGDYDNNGYLDILLIGSAGIFPDNEYYINILKNNGDCTFTDRIVSPSEGVSSGICRWLDFDNDGDLDIFISGEGSNGRVTEIFLNNGDLTFSKLENSNLVGVTGANGEWGDFDKDGDLDLAISGLSATGKVAKIYRNNASVSNTIPNPPLTIHSTIKGNSAILSWTPSSDSETPNNSLNYNLAIGSNSMESDIFSVMADLTSGYRKVTGPGRINDTTWIIKNLDAGTYYWSVQAIDQSFAGSVFSNQETFNTSFSNSVSPVDDQLLSPGVDGTTINVVETEESESRQWKYSYYSGGPYLYDIDEATATSYTPNFSNCGTYYVICASSKEGNTVFSNEIKIEVPCFTEINAGITALKYGKAIWGDYNNDDLLDVLVTGKQVTSRYTQIYSNAGNDVFNYENTISLPGIYSSSAAWGDYDQDGDLDILISGYGYVDFKWQRITRVYTNEGSNTFSELSNQPFIGLSDGSVAWSDFDNDGDLDIIITGTSGDECSTKIYWNIGNSYMESDMIIRGGQDIDIADYNKDNYKDLIVTGKDINGIQHTTIYKNNKEGNLLPQSDIHLTGTEDGSVSWGDYNNDGYPDILLTGSNNQETSISKVYKNNGDNSFSEQNDIALESIEFGDASWIDFDNDGDIDIFLSGYNEQQGIISKTYINNADESFTELPQEQFFGGVNGSIAFADYNSDGTIDLLVTGNDNEDIEHTTIYKSNLIQQNSIPTTPVNMSEVVTGNDARLSWDKATDTETPQGNIKYNVGVGTATGLFDVISPMADIGSGIQQIPGTSNALNNNELIINDLEVDTYYWHVQSVDDGLKASAFSEEGVFKIEPTFSSINGFAFSYNKPVWGDSDNDGDLDLLFTGIYTREADIYNNNDLNFEQYTGITMTKVVNGSSSWGDFDNDGDLDIVMTGFTDDQQNNTATMIYENDGTGEFVEVLTNALKGFGKSSTEWGDYDNDGDLDLLIAGYNPIDKQSTILYENIACDTFIESSANNFVGVELCSSAWGDYDNDGDLDLIQTGSTNGMVTGASTRLYKNNGDRTFTEVEALSLINISNGTVDWGDFDNDKDLDILLSGTDSLNNAILSIYVNDGNDEFHELSTNIRKVKESSSAWGDFNNDGYLDIVLSGISNNEITKVYRSINAESFVDLNILLSGFTNCVAWGDYDSDGDLDLALTAISDDMGYSGVSRNNSNFPNHIPTKPQNLKVSVYKSYMKLSWEKSTDLDFSEGKVYYNVRIGSSPGTSDILDPMSDLNTGKRKIPAIGNAQCNTFLYIDSLIRGQEYYWSVQAIDQSYTGGEWADEQSFTVPHVSADFEADTVCFGLETSFTDLSITFADPIIDWEWDFGDGTVSNLQNPLHMFATPGSFPVQLIVSSNDYSDTITKEIIVKEKIKADFSSETVCQGMPTPFTNNSIFNGLTAESWLWDFKDGQTSFEDNPGSNGFLNPGIYNVSMKVVDENGCIDSISKPVQVAAYPDASVTTDGPLSFCVGDSIRMEVTDNENYSYVWKRDGNLVPNGDLSNYTARISGSYTVDVINEIASCITTSESKVITVHNSPDVPTISELGPLTFCEGDSVVLFGSYDPDLAYSWKLDGGSTATDTSKISAKSKGVYTLEITNSFECKSKSINSKTVIVNPNPAVPNIDMDGSTTFCESDSVELSVNGDPSLNYQWLSDGSNISGATNNTYSVVSSGAYKLVVENADGCFKESSPVNVTVNVTPSSPTISTSGTTTFCEGGSVTLSVTDDPAITYEWLLNGGSIGTDLNEYTATASGAYTLRVSNSSGCIALSSNTVNVTANPVPGIPSVTVSGATTFCEGNTVELSVTDDPALNYQWLRDGSNISGATNNTYSAASSGAYKLAVENADGCFKESSPVIVTVNATPSSPTISTSGTTTFCEGGSVTLSVTDDPAITYEWLLNGGSIGTDLNEYTATASGAYNLRVSNSSGCIALSSNSVNVTVNPVPGIPSVTVSGVTTFCEGDSVVFSAPDNPNMYFQWINSETGISGETSNSIVVIASGSYSLRLRDSNSCRSISDPIEVLVNPSPPVPTITEQSSLVFCEGDSVILTLPEVPVSEGDEIQYQWKLNGGSTGTNSPFLVSKNSGIYSLEIINSYNCSTGSANSLYVKVNEKPEVPTVSLLGSLEFCDSDSSILSIGEVGNVLYRWFRDDILIPGSDTNVFIVDQSGDYSLNLINPSGCISESQTFSFKVNKTPVSPLISADGALSFCSGEAVNLKVPKVPVLTYEWLNDGVGTGITSTEIQVQSTGNYTVEVSNEECSILSKNSIEIAVHPSPPVAALSKSGIYNLCKDEAFSIAILEPSGDNYQWMNNEVELTGKISSSINISESGSYYVRVYNDFGCEVLSPVVDVIITEYPEVPLLKSENYIPSGCQSNEPVLLFNTSTEDNVNYQWVRNGTNLSGEENDTLIGYLSEAEYKLVASRLECSVESERLIINYADMPEKPSIIAEGPNIWYLACDNDSAFAYKWYYNETEISGAVEYIYIANEKSGKYEVAISEEVNGCYAYSDPIWIPLGTGIGENPWKDLKIYPNPAPGLFTLEMDNNIMGELIIDIFGTLGNQIINIKFTKETAHFRTMIDLSGQPTGAYLVGLNLEHYTTQKTLIIE